MLEVRDLKVRINGHPILNGLDLDLLPGQLLVLAGPNGAGKTTLIRALNGWIRPDSGSCRLNGRSVEAMSRREVAQNIAVVAQETEARFPITVEQFVLSGQFVYGTAFGWESVGEVERAHEAITSCDLAGALSKFLSELSGGERQRVVLARALATPARLFLLDEPTANLDIKHQEKMFRLVHERCRAQGAGAIVITHDLNLAAAFADNVMVLSEGRVAASGRPSNVFTETMIREVFGVQTIVDTNPVTAGVRITSLFGVTTGN